MEQPAIRVLDEQTGITLTPGKPKQCAGNGDKLDSNGNLVECCCDECDYLLDCMKSEEWKVGQ